MRIKIVSLLTLILIISSCAYQYPAALTGSKADGIITIAYEYTSQNPDSWETEWEIANDSAKQKCKAWGYSNAIKFDLTYRDCILYNWYGCLKWREFVDYQCVD